MTPFATYVLILTVQQVYASPSRHDMEKKGKSAELCYPNIFFTVDNFDEVCGLFVIFFLFIKFFK